MPAPERPWDCIPPETWQRLVAHVVELGDFDLETAAQDVGLDKDQIAALRVWVATIEAEVEGRRLRKEMTPSTARFIESLIADIDPGERAAAEKEIAGLRRPRR